MVHCSEIVQIIKGLDISANLAGLATVLLHCSADEHFVTSLLVTPQNLEPLRPVFLAGLSKHSRSDIEFWKCLVNLSGHAQLRYSVYFSLVRPFLKSICIYDAVDSASAKYVMTSLSNLSLDMDIATDICLLFIDLDTWNCLLSSFCTSSSMSLAHIYGDFLRLLVHLARIPSFQEFLCGNSFETLLVLVRVSCDPLDLFPLCGIIKNCLMGIEYHQEFLYHTELLALLISALPMAKILLDSKDYYEISPQLQAFFELSSAKVVWKETSRTSPRLLHNDFPHDVLDIILLLCTVRTCRDFLRELNIYILLRNLHLNTDDNDVLQRIDCIVQYLKRDESD